MEMVHISFLSRLASLFIFRETYQKTTSFCYHKTTFYLFSHFDDIISEIRNSLCNVQNFINHDTNP